MKTSPKTGAQFRIEKGIKIPFHARSPGPIPYPFQDMEVGNSFLVPAAAEELKRLLHRMYQTSIRFRKQFGSEYAFTFRTVEGGVRCWRTA